MWNLSFTPPELIEARVLTRLPDELRRPQRSDWADANKPGHIVDCFLEGPSFDRAGNLYVTDIPHGRIFRISAPKTPAASSPQGGAFGLGRPGAEPTPALEWQLVAQYDGWPNGTALHADGSLWIADYRRGLLRLDPSTGQVSTVLGHRNSESFKGVNDLTFDALGHCYFTDQGQSGLHDPTGRVYRLRDNGQLDLLLSNAPSPNGIALSPDGRVLFVAVTRGNAVWRAPLLPDGSLSKMGAFQTFFGTSGPDGMAVDVEGRLVVAHASLGGAFVLNARGEVTHFVRSPTGGTVTNLAYHPGTNQIVMTESATGTVLMADLPAPGAPLYSA